MYNSGYDYGNGGSIQRLSLKFVVLEIEWWGGGGRTRHTGSPGEEEIRLTGQVFYYSQRFNC